MGCEEYQARAYARIAGVIMADKTTVRMKCGDIYADIYDSPETIAQAISDGFNLADEPCDTVDSGTVKKKSGSKAEPDGKT